jgi:putative copper resistance protein D
LIDWLLRAARLMQYAAILGLLGAAAPVMGATDWACTRRVRRWVPAAACVGIAGVALWLACESIQIAGTWNAWPTLLWQTRFGRLAGLRAAALLLAGLTSVISANPKRARVGVGLLSAASTLGFAWSGHGAMGEGLTRWAHLACDVLHLLAAGCWLGALVCLSAQAIRLRAEDLLGVEQFARQLSRFSLAGPWIVAVLAATGVVNSALLLGPHPMDALMRESYGNLLLLKVALFALMLLLAAVNRLRLVPALHAAARLVPGPGPAATALHRLRISLSAEALLGFLVLAAVAILGSLQPPISRGSDEVGYGGPQSFFCLSV